MEIEIPSGGCSVLSSSNTIDHYQNNIRVRYYIYDGKLVRSSSSNYSNLPSNSYCLQPGDLVYKPEIEIYFSAIAFALVAFAGILLYNLVIKKLWSTR